MEKGVAHSPQEGGSDMVFSSSAPFDRSEHWWHTWMEAPITSGDIFDSKTWRCCSLRQPSLQFAYFSWVFSISEKKMPNFFPISILKILAKGVVKDWKY